MYTNTLFTLLSNYIVNCQLQVLKLVTSKSTVLNCSMSIVGIASDHEQQVTS